MKNKEKKDKKHKPKYTYSPSKTFWLATFAMIFFLSATNPEPVAAAIANALWGVVFVYDVETRKKKESTL